MRPAAAFVALALALVAGAAQAEVAGSVLFALGRVEIARGDQLLQAGRGTPLEVGDTVSTGPTGLAQLRMKDGALLSLRSGTSMTVEVFQLPAQSGPVSDTSAAEPAAVSRGGRSLLRLLRGAFRTVTGLIGKGADDEYQVATPAATIGIRGTDYSAAWCAGSCGGTPDGLYVGVANGEIVVFNAAGELVVRDDHYGYVRDADTPPRDIDPPAILDQAVDGEPGDDDDRDSGGGDSGRGDGATTGNTQPEGTYELLPGRRGQLAFGTGPFEASDHFAGGSSTGVYTRDDGALVGFLAATPQRVAFYGIGSARALDLGSDAASGLRWGRWSGGTANVGGNPLDLTSQSLHWIYALSPSAPALPVSGTASFTLVGNTQPTDNLGNVGFLGNATLFADFTNQTVDSTLDLGINNQVWQASGSGSLRSGTAIFAGSYGTVNINDAVGSPLGTGSGGFAGFFTGNAAGAGLSFSLSDGSTSVSGAAAFVRDTTQAQGQGVGGP